MNVVINNGLLYDILSCISLFSSVRSIRHLGFVNKALYQTIFDDYNHFIHIIASNNTIVCYEEMKNDLYLEYLRESESPKGSPEYYDSRPDINEDNKTNISFSLSLGEYPIICVDFGPECGHHYHLCLITIKINLEYAYYHFLPFVDEEAAWTPEYYYDEQDIDKYSKIEEHKFTDFADFGKCFISDLYNYDVSSFDSEYSVSRKCCINNIINYSLL